MRQKAALYYPDVDYPEDEDRDYDFDPDWDDDSSDDWDLGDY